MGADSARASQTHSNAFFRRFGGRQTAFDAKQRVFQLQQVFFPLQALALAQALNGRHQHLNLFSQVLHSHLQRLNVVPVLFGFVGNEEQPLNVIKKLLQHGQ